MDLNIIEKLKLLKAKKALLQTKRRELEHEIERDDAALDKLNGEYWETNKMISLNASIEANQKKISELELEIKPIDEQLQMEKPYFQEKAIKLIGKIKGYDLLMGFLNEKSVNSEIDISTLYDQFAEICYGGEEAPMESLIDPEMVYAFMYQNSVDYNKLIKQKEVLDKETQQIDKVLTVANYELRKINAIEVEFFDEITTEAGHEKEVLEIAKKVVDSHEGSLTIEEKTNMMSNYELRHHDNQGNSISIAPKK